MRWSRGHFGFTLLFDLSGSRTRQAGAKARGYRSVKNFITMVYIVAGKLDFGLRT